jgi:hypothetical protein
MKSSVFPAFHDPPAAGTMEGFFFFHLFPEFPGQPLGNHADGDEGVDKLLIRRVPAGRPVLRNNHVRSSFPRGFLPLWFLKGKSRTFFRKILKVFFGDEKSPPTPSTPEREKRAGFPKNHRKNFLCGFSEKRLQIPF